MYYKYLAYIFFIITWSIQAVSTDKIKLAAYDIPFILQSDAKGDYDKVFEQVKIIADRTWHYDVLPPARVDLLFDFGKVDCIVPFDKKFHHNIDTINSDHFFIATAYIYTIAGSNPIDSLKQLVNKKVGARNGMLYGPEFDALNLRIEYVESIAQNIEKLNAGRIDAFVAWSPDSLAAFKEKGIEPLPHALPFITHKDSFLCHNTSQSIQFIEEFNRALKQVK